MIIKKCFFTFLLSVGLLMSGCSGRVELNELLIVSAIGVDIKEDNTAVHFQVVNAGGSAGGQGGAPAGASGGAVYTYSVTGKTVYEAVEKASTILPRKLLFSHVTCIVVGEEYARQKGIDGLFDFLERNHGIRDSMLMLVAKESTAKNILTIYTPIFKNPAESLRNRVKQSAAATGVAEGVQEKEVINWIHGQYRDPVIQGVERVEFDNQADDTQNLQNIDANNKTFRITGLAYFKKDKMKGWYNTKQTRGWAIINSRAHEMFILSHKCNHSKGYVGSLIKGIKTDVTPKVHDGQLSYKINVKGKAILQEVTCKINVGSPKELKKIEFQIEEELTKELTSVIDKAQSKKLDVFGFGKLLYDNHPEMWRKYKKDWAEHFSDANVKTTVNITLETVGARVESIHEQ
ncbi:Ger(x)C family spore germination protein [Fictibacillus aquaticus]|uniref:Uncharacterized protein n=1 Tax=Fictibacillus aquaticus TaxID=2021314 RepID=A0A235FCS5_9BACL|nr:Ger(x)C family spore germination protein [Fictibacillus aquaticus]OYD58595.1 hypothetical protein CGZ90_01450 [Fictibacillus aquaticus]